MTVPIHTTPIQVDTFVDIGVREGNVSAQTAGPTTARLSGQLLDEKIYQHWLSVWLNALAPTQSPIDAYEMGLKLTNDTEIQQLNTDYRQKDKPTDVLSFAALETDLPGIEKLHQEQPLYLGDIIISVETAARQASSAGHPLKKEIAWLTAHGLLHLLGWDHPDAHSLEVMLDKQTELLALVKL